MNQHAAKKEIPGLDWKNLLSVPDAKGFVRETGEYPATLLGELAYRFRELYWRTNDHPRPTGGQVAHTAHLVGRLTKELRGTPLPRRTPEELELINYLVTPGRIEALDITTSWLEGGAISDTQHGAALQRAL